MMEAHPSAVVLKEKGPRREELLPSNNARGTEKRIRDVNRSERKRVA